MPRLHRPHDLVGVELEDEQRHDTEQQPAGDEADGQRGDGGESIAVIFGHIGGEPGLDSRIERSPQADAEHGKDRQRDEHAFDEHFHNGGIAQLAQRQGKGAG